MASIKANFFLSSLQLRGSQRENSSSSELCQKTRLSKNYLVLATLYFNLMSVLYCHFLVRLNMSSTYRPFPIWLVRSPRTATWPASWRLWFSNSFCMLENCLFSCSFFAVTIPICFWRYQISQLNYSYAALMAPSFPLSPSYALLASIDFQSRPAHSFQSSFFCPQIFFFMVLSFLFSFIWSNYPLVRIRSSLYCSSLAASMSSASALSFPLSFSMKSFKSWKHLMCLLWQSSIWSLEWQAGECMSDRIMQFAIRNRCQGYYNFHQLICCWGGELYIIYMNRLVNLAMRPSYFFSTVAKKKQMQLTLRTPYQTIFSDFSGFSRIITKSQDSTVVIQNRTPGAMYVLPPGPLKIKLTQPLANTSGEYLHTGGWMIVHSDNSCEINVMDIFEKKDLRADQMFKTETKDASDVTGKYLSAFKRGVNKRWEKKLS